MCVYVYVHVRVCVRACACMYDIKVSKDLRWHLGSERDIYMLFVFAGPVQEATIIGELQRDGRDDQSSQRRDTWS